MPSRTPARTRAAARKARDDSGRCRALSGIATGQLREQHLPARTLQHAESMFRFVKKHAWLARGCVSAALATHTTVLHAQDTPVSESPQSAAPQPPGDERAPPRPKRQRSHQRQHRSREAWPGYAPLLLGAYLTAPVLGLGLPYVATRVTQRSLTVAEFVMGMAAFLLTPSVVHWSNGELGLGLRALFVLPLVIAVSVAATALVGYAAGSGMRYTEPPCEEWRRDFCGESNGIALEPAVGVAAWAGVVGAGLGAIGWAMFDVYQATRKPSTTYAQFMIVPSPQGLSGSFATRF